jgi:hypothetical protein
MSFAPSFTSSIISSIQSMPLRTPVLNPHVTHICDYVPEILTNDNYLTWSHLFFSLFYANWNCLACLISSWINVIWLLRTSFIFFIVQELLVQREAWLVLHKHILDKSIAKELDLKVQVQNHKKNNIFIYTNCQEL